MAVVSSKQSEIDALLREKELMIAHMRTIMHSTTDVSKMSGDQARWVLQIVHAMVTVLITAPGK